MTRRIGVALGNALTMVAALTVAVAASPAHADPATLYVGTSNCSDQGSGTADRPFCTVQKAADVVNPGQRVSIFGSHVESVFVNRSGTVAAPIVFEGVSPNSASVGRVGGLAPTIHMSGVHDVRVANLTILSRESVPAVLVNTASRIVVERNTVTATSQALPGADGVLLTGGSSQVTVSRNTFTVYGQSIRVDGGADVTIAANDLPQGPNGGITVIGAQHTAITGNTVLESCNRGIDIRGGSGTSVQNNIVAFPLGATESSYCSPVQSHAIIVDAAAAPAVTLDYNIAYLRVPRAYGWAGTDYPSAAELRAATGQGAHELNVNPNVGTPAVDSANADAPGELDSDFDGKPRVDNPLVPNTGTGAIGYHDRGAHEAQDRFTSGRVTGSAFTAPVGGQITVTGAFSDEWGLPTTCAFDFGDGTAATASPCTSTHTYAATGDYVITVDATNAAQLARREVWRIGIRPAGGRLEPSLTATPDSALHLILQAGGGSDPWNIASITVDFGDGTPPGTAAGTSAFHIYDRPGNYLVRATLTDAAGATGSTSTVFSTASSGFVPFGPNRLLDTRTGVGTGGTVRKVAPGGTVRLAVGGTAGIPAGATAVAMNVTVTNPTDGGFVSVYPDGVTRPLVSTLNFNAGQTVPNATIVPIGTNGFVDLYNGSPGTSDLVADVTGYFTRTGTIDGYRQVRPTRLFDTRDAGSAPILGGHVLTRTVVGGQVPSNATAVIINATVTNPQGLGFVTAYPAGATRPVASNLNYVAGQTIANSVTVPVGTNGQVSFYTSTTTDLVADVAGYFIRNDVNYFVPVAPVRTIDTRTMARGPLAPGETASFNLSLAGPNFLGGPSAVVYNATVTDTHATGYLTAWFAADPRPTASNLNFTAGAIVPNQAVTGLFGSFVQPNVSFYNGSTGTINLVVDISGYFGAP